MAVMSVPIVSVSSESSRDPTTSTAQVEIVPEELDRREEHREQLLGVDVRCPVLVVQLVELPLELALAVERLDDRHPRDRLGHLCGDGGDAIADVQLRDGGLALEPPREHERGRQDHHRHEPQPPVDDEEHDDRRRQEDDVRDERRQALRERVRDRVDVARHPGDDPSRPLLREVAQRERGEVVEQVAAEPEDDPLADDREAADQHELADPADGVQAR